ncbi:DUF805 domain-containing protein [Rhodoplanes elegans]|uniref:DUF805 domain-containing protein n=1 Tax=Rhodoplanes elegans TaxID=29408 RepID=A0A327K9C1_9BRAD|nr:DUF805 domain-containing protein [Rhodoplanes elegans]MBK5962427.1 DUF805 domain-containing protein [Rhodoplanes elegans]RAI34295.1 DUF805 domain-containing protein [Rhodoplanes elegans]
MTFAEAIASGFRNYVGFEGRASRSEYWFWVLFVILVSLATGILDYIIFGPGGLSPINALASLALFLPGLAVGVRRLHDIDRTGWWMLLVITLIGGLVLLVFFVMRGTPGPNRFGPDPLAGAMPAGPAY